MKKENPEERVQNPYSEFACFCFFLFSSNIHQPANAIPVLSK
jgi:hypothetical protein